MSLIVELSRLAQRVLDGFSVAEEVVGCLSCSEADSADSLSNEADQLCRVCLHVVPLPSLIGPRV